MNKTSCQELIYYFNNAYLSVTREALGRKVFDQCQQLSGSEHTEQNHLELNKSLASRSD